MKSSAIEVDRVFGHLMVRIHIREERVETRFISKQGPRFFEKLVLGRRFYEVPYIVSRICGACSIAHLLASIRALEKAMGVEIHEDIHQLRDLVNQLQHAQNDVVHLTYLALPDYLRVKDLNEMMKVVPDIIKIGMKLNSLCLRAVELLVGRIVNPVGCNVGGFYRDLDKSRIIRCIEVLKEAQDLARKFVDFVMKLQLPSIEEPSTLHAVLESPREYLVSGERIVLSNGIRIPTEDYVKVFREFEVEDSTSKIVVVENRALYVGPRARVNIYFERLRRLRDYLKYIAVPSRNPFENVKAKALEMLYTISNVCEKLEEFVDRRPRLKVDVRVREGEGVGAIEAPRGLLIHHYRVDSDGRIVFANIVTPTVFNAKHIEESARVLVQNIISRSDALNVDHIRDLVSMLVRAYDPCLPCATHVVVLGGNNEKRT